MCLELLGIFIGIVPSTEQGDELSRDKAGGERCGPGDGDA
jgi:hypothetical protein